MEQCNVKLPSSPQNKSGGTHPISAALKAKIINLQDIIKRTILSSQRYKVLDIFGANELNVCVNSLETMFSTLRALLVHIDEGVKIDEDEMIRVLQDITNDLSSLFRTFGTHSVEDLILVCFGAEFAHKNFTKKSVVSKYDVMRRYVHPISYKVINWKTDNKNVCVSPKRRVLQKNRIIEDFMIVETGQNFDCFDLARTSKSFQTKVYGVKFCIQNPAQHKTLVICGLVDDLMVECLNYPFVSDKMGSIEDEKPGDQEFTSSAFERFTKCLSLKEILVYSNQELYNRFMGYMNQVALIKQKTIAQVTKEFISSELYGQRSTLIQLLLKSSEHEFQYLAYLLYDLLSNDSNGRVDTQDQTLLFDSLPWSVKKYFRDAMKQTMSYTSNLANFENTKIPLEQQICLMKSNDVIKEKAMVKLKEVKAKSEDSGSKARSYLEGLLRIPFGIYKEEPILSTLSQCSTIFGELVKTLNNSEFPIETFPNKEEYGSVEVRQYSALLREDHVEVMRVKHALLVKKGLTSAKRNILISNICYINGLIKKYALNVPKICHSGKKTSYMREHISEFVDSISHEHDIISEIAFKCGAIKDNSNMISSLNNNLSEIETKMEIANAFLGKVTDVMDGAVHGHNKAKRQIERIIGQWMNGEKSGYCFGFEGPPGVGKTSLAKKGIAHCLKDDSGVTRPFSFVAVGGSSNGSTLDGHNYTYVGSTWGRIVDILMEKKCMNPIIFIDELDKVSRTEHGNELIGILTHLIDPTQNDSFQDKYFNGIDLDMSRALFIFSYNDASCIDRILLDRIHRIKFDHQSLEDKLVIARKYLLPEVFKKMGLEGVIDLSDEVIEYVIEEYTCEPGVRKLKEILFEIVGEINLSILKDSEDHDLPIVISEDDIKYKYLENRHEMKRKKIHTESAVGLISGLWANSMGQGGVLPIEAKFYPCGTFLDLKLTGMQGDVMKESMTVAKTLAWSLLTNSRMAEIQKSIHKTKCQGVHIHVPEGATPKDGPSAGTAITIVMYSLFSKRKIKQHIAITGEMCLQGKVTAIGGLDLKILGGIRAGVKQFIFPKENDKHYLEFMKKYGDKPIVDGIEFTQVETIQDVVDIVFED
jgi:ATP-dependent Lon protease